VADRPADLIEGFFDVGRDREDVADIAQRHLLAEVDAELVVVGRVERRDAADALRPEAGAGPVGGAAVERHADHGGIEIADPGHVLDIGRLQEGVDAGIVRELAAREGRDGLVGEAVRTGQPHPQRPGALLVPAGGGECPLLHRRLPAARLEAVEIGMVAVLGRTGAAAPMSRNLSHAHSP